MAALASPLVALVLLAGILLTVVHMRIGMQVIIEDYVHEEMPKLALLIANWLFSWARRADGDLRRPEDSPSEAECTRT